VKNKRFVLFSLLVLASMILTACGGKVTEVLVTEPPAPATEAPTTAPEPTPSLNVSIAAFDGAALSVPDCDYGGWFKSIEAANEYTVTVRLCRPDPAFLSKIALPAFSIYPSGWIESTAENGMRTAEGLEHPIGTGPYMMGGWKRGESITLTANPDYWGGMPAVQTLVIRWEADFATRLADLQAGIVDGIDNVRPGDYETVRRDPLLSLLERPTRDSLNLDIPSLFASLPNTAHEPSAVAYRADVIHPQASPLGYELFYLSAPGDRDVFVWIQTTEPSSLFCADEAEGDALRVCAQAVESLYAYEINGTTVKPALAESCAPNADLTVWVCALRQDVTFHDGSTFDAFDVVATFNMGLNIGSPFHAGHTNLWEYYEYLWGLMKKPGG